MTLLANAPWVVVAILIAWFAFLLVACALCASAARGDATVEKQFASGRPVALDALESMGSEAEVVDFGGWRHRTR